MRSLPGIGSHESSLRQTDEWLTPRHVLDALGPFDLDPSCPPRRPWPTAAVHLTEEDDGLTYPWEGRVWLNPPYSTAAPWMEKMARHGHGTALVFARTEVAWFQQWVWPYASALLFLAGRLAFVRWDGKESKAGTSAGAPSVLIAYGPDDAERLMGCGLPGGFVRSAHMVARTA